MPRDFEWSAQNYSVRDVIYSLTDQLPLIVRVTEGYCSNDYFHDFGAEQVLRVYDVARQERVVVRESGGRYLSIPCSYPGHVRINYRNRKVVNDVSISAVADIIRKQTSSNFTMIFMVDKSIQTVYRHDGDNGDEGAANDFGVLQPINVYQEPYLAAHTLVDRELHPTNTFIPAYVSIAMSVAVGLTDGTQREFAKVLAGFDVAAAACRHDCVIGKQKIIAFPHSPCQSDYEFIVPVMHINVAQTDDWRTDYDGYLKSVPTLPRTRPAEEEDYYDYCTPPSRRSPPTGQSTPARRPQEQPPVAAPPIPARHPTNKRSTPVRKTPIATGPKEVVPANSMAAVLAELTKFNVRDDSKRSAGVKPPVAAVSPQPTVPLAPSRGVSRMPQAAHSRSVLPARNADRPPAMPPASRPSDGPTPTLGCASLTGSTATAVGDQDDDILSKDVHSLSTDDVSVCLTLLKMSEHVDDFVDKDVDGEMLSCLDEAILVDEFRFSRFNAKKLIKFVTEGYIPRTSTKRPTRDSKT